MRRDEKTESVDVPEDSRWVLERRTARSILVSLTELRKASKYDLASKLGVSYATVVNYIAKFIDSDLVEEIGEVEARRGGRKTLYRPTQKALTLLSKAKSPEAPIAATQKHDTLYTFGFHSRAVANASGYGSMRSDKEKEIQDVLNEMKIDVAVVINYKGHPIPVVPLSTLGRIDQANAIFSEDVKQRIFQVAIEAAKKLARKERP